MIEHKFFDETKAGCYGDGTFGHQHVRNQLAEVLTLILDKESSAQIINIQRNLATEMPDDCWDEEAALELLQEHTNDDCTWEFADGDLLLIPLCACGECSA